MSEMKIWNNITEKSLSDEIERLTKRNEYQRQNINQLQYTNRILEEHLNVVESNEEINEARTKENEEKNDQIKEMKSLKKKIGTTNKSNFYI